MLAELVLQELQQVARPEKAAFFPIFFQARPGGYGEGDQFLGCVVPDVRVIARRSRDLPRHELNQLLRSPWHECRLTALLILVAQFELAMKQKVDRENDSRNIVEFYLASLDRVNNWDLVDTSAPKLLGNWLLKNPGERPVLKRLAKSELLWERRVAVVATMPLIHANELNEILMLAKMLLHDKHDLMHKAIGWMLREVWKQEPVALRLFLADNIAQMPRTMLRYAIERMPEKERKLWLGRS